MKWLLPYAEGTTTMATAAAPSASEPDCPSPSSPALFSAAGTDANKDQTDSGRSSPSVSSSSSSAADGFGFSTSEQRSPSSTSALCFGAGGAGVRLWSSSKALARASKIHGEEEDDAQAAAASVAPKGYAVGRHLRRISRPLRKARAANKGTAAAPRRGAVDDDDMARERAEAVASAIAHCKETFRRGVPRRRRRPPPLSSLSLDLWLRDRQDEIIASAGECCAVRRPTPATALARHAAPSMRLPLPYIAPPAAAATTGTPPSQISGLASRETETRGGFSELEFLKTFDGDDELIDRHFITVQI